VKQFVLVEDFREGADNAEKDAFDYVTAQQTHRGSIHRALHD
jgi:hypothetical protein